MLNEIKPFYSKKNVCIENIYTSMCKALNRNDKDIYAYSWNFGYIQHNESFARKIKFSRDGQAINTEQSYAFEKYCGIKPIWHMNCDMEHFIDIVKKELEANRPIGLGIDIFSCNWHVFANKYHFVHYCLIVGIDDQGFICIDDTLASNDGVLAVSPRPENVRIDFNTFKKYNFGFVTFEITPDIPYVSCDELIYLSVLKTMTGFNGISDFDNMRSLLLDIEQHFDIDKEIGETNDIRAIEVIRSFGCIAWSRNNYSMFLMDKKDHSDFDIIYIAGKMTEAAALWEAISNYILKYALDGKDGKFNKKLVCDQLNKIITLEENLAKYIVKEYETKKYLQNI